MSEGKSDAEKMQRSAGGRWQLRDWAFCVLYPDGDGGQQTQVGGVFAGQRGGRVKDFMQFLRH